ncbi:MAG: hypothetical protein GTO41_04900, partial [Burkholderiales bacterium]|nr:hypothetical protein [Burkholderiales bacterium]
MPVAFIPVTKPCSFFPSQKMLVLSRKQDEKIRIGEDVEVVVCRLGRHRVRLGINAPQHIVIRRSELPWSAGPTVAPAAG